MDFFIRFNPTATTKPSNHLWALTRESSKLIKTVARWAPMILSMSILSTRYFVKKKQIIWGEWFYYFFGISWWDVCFLLKSTKYTVYTITLLKLFSILDIEFLSPIGPWFHSHADGPFNLLSIRSPLQSLKERPPFKLDKKPSNLKKLSQLLISHFWNTSGKFIPVDSWSKRETMTNAKNISCIILKMRQLLKLLLDQNLIVINHKFNSDFKSLIILYSSSKSCDRCIYKKGMDQIVNRKVI